MFIPLRDENPTTRFPAVTVALIAGVLGAYGALFPRARVKTFIFLIFYIDVVAIPAGIVLGVWFLLQIFNVGMGGGVAWFAHIGGFLAGILLIWLALGKGFRRPSRRES